MGWTRKSRRAALRHCRPDIEALESRKLLTVSLEHPATRHGHAALAPLTSSPSPTASSLSSAAAAAGDIIGAAQTRNSYGVNGSGMTVAVIDTGINYNHEALGGGFGAGHKVVAGYDFTQNDGDPLSTTAMHGTAVSGLIASSDPAHPGVAPGADIAALKVFNSDSAGSFDYVAQALQWVVDNHSRYQITAVNLSMADGNNYAQNWFAQDGGIGQRITGLVNQLSALNIPVIAATGNSFNGQQGEGFPAIIPATISVTSTDSSGQHITSDAQREGATIGGISATDIAAPGEGLTAPVQGNQFAKVDGTSFAAAEVSGAVVLLQQIYQSRFGQLPTVDQIDSWLEEGSDPVNDPVTGIAIGRLDIPRAAGFIPDPQPQVLKVSDSGAGSALLAWSTSGGVISAPGSAASSAASAAPVPQPPPASTSASALATVQQVSQDTAPTVPNPPAAPPTNTNVPGLIAGAFKALSQWGGGGDVGRGAQVWSNVSTARKKLGDSQPSGQIKSLVGTNHRIAAAPGSTRNLRHSPFVKGGHHR